MWSYIVRRILLGILVLFGVITITFFLVRVVPSNRLLAGSVKTTAEQIEQATKELGLINPICTVLEIYIRIGKGDWGYSIRTKQPV